MKKLLAFLVFFLPFAALADTGPYTHSGTSNLLHIFVEDTTKTATDASIGLTGLAFNTASLELHHKCDVEASFVDYTSAASKILDITTIGTYAAPTNSDEIRFKAVDGTDAPGLYEVHIRNERHAVANAKSCTLTWKGATNMRTGFLKYTLTRFDTQSATPNVNVSSADTNAFQRQDFASDGNAQASAATTITIAGAEAYCTNCLKNRQVCIVGGKGLGQCREIASNVLGTDVVTITRAWESTLEPDTTSEYVIGGIGLDPDAAYTNHNVSGSIGEKWNTTSSSSGTNMVNSDAWDILPTTTFSSAVVSSAQTAVEIPKNFVPSKIVLDAPAGTGTSPTLDIVIQHSVDRTNWTTLTTFTQVTGSSSYQRNTISESVERYVRAVVTVGGTSPSFVGVKIQMWGNTNAANK